VVDPLPPETSFVSCQTTLGTCTGPVPGTTGIVTADLGTLPAGSGAVVRIRVVLAAGAAGSLSNTATVTTSTPDSNPDNNSDAVVVVTGAPIPTLSAPMLALLALALAALGLSVLRRTGA
jgi:Mrp family chromosome partitioning ATPase